MSAPYRLFRPLPVDQAMDKKYSGPAALFEEVLQQGGAFFRHDASTYVDLVIQLCRLQYIEYTAPGAGTWFDSAENHFLDARMHHGPGTHDARLDSYVQSGIQ